MATPVPDTLDALLTRRDAAAALSAAGYPVARATLATRAVRGGGPPFQRFGRVPLYRWGDLLAWAEGSPVTVVETAADRGWAYPYRTHSRDGHNLGRARQTEQRWSLGGAAAPSSVNCSRARAYMCRRRCHDNGRDMFRVEIAPTARTIFVAVSLYRPRVEDKSQFPLSSLFPSLLTFPGRPRPFEILGPRRWRRYFPWDQPPSLHLRF
jgi:hypothetical protein